MHSLHRAIAKVCNTLIEMRAFNVFCEVCSALKESVINWSNLTISLQMIEYGQVIIFLQFLWKFHLYSQRPVHFCVSLCVLLSFAQVVSWRKSKVKKITVIDFDICNSTAPPRKLYSVTVTCFFQVKFGSVTYERPRWSSGYTLGCWCEGFGVQFPGRPRIFEI